MHPVYTTNDSIRQRADQCSVDSGVRLALDSCQLHRIDERNTAEDVELPYVVDDQIWGVSGYRYFLHLLSAQCARFPC